MQKVDVSLMDLPKTNVFTSKLPPDPAFRTPETSHKAPRKALGPRPVEGAMYTFVRPETVERSELLDVSPKAMEDLGLSCKEKDTPEFKAMVMGNKIFWTEENGGIYPWAQCYGGPHLENQSVKANILLILLQGGSCSSLPSTQFSHVNSVPVVHGRANLVMG
jgi:hypothetical protein